jgi:AcrR family transcriptional regulator
MMSQKNRQKILDAAEQSFYSKGYIGTTMAAVCKAANISPATLYHYFQSKRELFEAAGIPDFLLSETPPRRRDILDAALDLFSNQGYQATTMTQIAARAGIARATLYSQFPTKETLLKALLQESPFLSLVQHFIEAKELPGIEFDKDPVGALEYLARQYLMSFKDPRRVALFRLILAEGVRFPSLQEAFHQMVNNGIVIVSQYISRLAPGLADPQFCARTFLGTLLVFVLNEQIVPGNRSHSYTPEEIAHKATTQLLTSLQPSV